MTSHHFRTTEDQVIVFLPIVATRPHIHE